MHDLKDNKNAVLFTIYFTVGLTRRFWMAPVCIVDLHTTPFVYFRFNNKINNILRLNLSFKRNGVRNKVFFFCLYILLSILMIYSWMNQQFETLWNIHIHLWLRSSFSNKFQISLFPEFEDLINLIYRTSLPTHVGFLK